MSGALASCFGERYRDVEDFRWKQYSNKYRLLYSSTSYVNNSVTERVGVCATCSLLGTPILSVVMWNQLCTTCCRWWYHFCCVANKERSPRKDIWKAEPPVKRLCLPSSVDALARLPKHNNGPRCLRPSTVPACSQLGDTLAASTWPSGSHHQASQTTYHP